jgi:hypothetical protein
MGGAADRRGERFSAAAAEQIGWRQRRGESHVRVDVLDPNACEGEGQRERG